MTRVHPILNCKINHHRLFRAGLCLIALFVLLDLAAKVLGTVWPATHEVLHLFKLDHEDSIPNWFKSIELAVCAVTLFVLARHKRESRDRFARHWSGLAVIFTCMSIEEIAANHEAITEPLHRALHTQGLLYFAWIIPVGAITLVIGLAYLKFVLAFPPHLRGGLILSGMLYVGAALGLESLGGWWVNEHGMNNLIFGLETAAEEGLQMVGALLFLRVLLQHAGDCAIELNMQIDDEVTGPISLPRVVPPTSRAA